MACHAPHPTPLTPFPLEVLYFPWVSSKTALPTKMAEDHVWLMDMMAQCGALVDKLKGGSVDPDVVKDLEVAGEGCGVGGGEVTRKEEGKGDQGPSAMKYTRATHTHACPHSRPPSLPSRARWSLTSRRRKRCSCPSCASSAPRCVYMGRDGGVHAHHKQVLHRGGGKG
jgi:hypothetical protein